MDSVRSRVPVQDLGALETVEFRRGGDAVGADVLCVEVVADLQVGGKVLRERDFVGVVTGRSDDGTDLRRAGLVRVGIGNPVNSEDAQ